MTQSKMVKHQTHKANKYSQETFHSRKSTIVTRRYFLHHLEHFSIDLTILNFILVKHLLQYCSNSL